FAPVSAPSPMVARLLRNRNKPVSPACYCFDVAGSGGRVSQGPAKSMYALVEAALEVNESIVLPQMLLEFLSRAYLSRIFQQQRQDSGSLRLQLDLKSVPPQLTGLRTELEDSETNDTWGQSWIFHGARFRSLCIQFFGTRDGLATRYAGQSGGCAGLTSCLAGVRRTSSANANAQQQVILQRISDQSLERCSPHTALVVELCGNPAVRVNDYESLIDIVSTGNDAGVS